MSLATRCPSCGTVFRVVRDQLKVSDGWVRCGRCADVFNAAERLFELESDGGGAATSPGAADAGHIADRPMPRAAQTPPDAMAGDASYGAGGTAWHAIGRPPAPEPSSKAAPLTAPAPPDEAAPEADAAAEAVLGPPTTLLPAPSRSTLEPDAELARPPSAVPASAPASTVAGSPAARADSTEELGTSPSASPAPPQTVAAAESAPAAEAVPEPEPEPSPLAAGATSTDAARPGTDADGASAALTQDSAVTDATALQSPVAAASAAATTPEFIRKADRAARRRQPVRRGPMAALAGVLLALLLGQVGMHYRDLLAASWPGTRPLLQAACSLFGCDVQAPRRIEALSVESSGLARMQGSPLYRLSVVVRNKATTAVRMPAVELALSDAQGLTVVRRVLSPAELGQSAQSLPAGGEVMLQASLDLGERRVTGYTVELFYP